MSEETKEAVSEPENSEELSTSENTASEQASPHKGFFGKVDNYFGVTKKGSNFKTEIIAGLTTFMAMAYILMVNPSIFTASFEAGGPQIIGDITFGGMYIATAIGAIVGTLLMAFLAKMPLAQASGLGVNAFVVYTLVGTNGLTYANAMVFTLLDGIIFILLTVTGLRKYIFEAIPEEVRKAINVGIGLFIAFIGLQNAGIVVDSSTLVSFVSFNVLAKGASFSSMLPALVALIGVIAIGIMSHKGIKGSILWGVLGSAVLYYILAAIGYGAGDAACKAIFTDISDSWTSPITAFSDWGTQNVGQVFAKGFDFSAYLDSNGAGALVILIITSALSLCMVDMFDTLGTLYGACSKGNLLDENGNPLNINKCMLSDAIATCAGAIAGTSTVTTFVESSSGVATGGKTGFTALVTGLCFLVAMFLSPIAQLIPSAATATALIYVGVLMMTSVADIDWKDPAVAIVAFLTIAVMAFGYSISKGIGVGMIASVIISICTGKIKEIRIATWVIAVLYIAMFILTT